MHPYCPLAPFLPFAKMAKDLNFIYHFCSFSYSSLLQKCIFVFVYIDWISRQKTKRITKLLHKCFKRVSLYIIYRAVRATDHLGFFSIFLLEKKSFANAQKHGDIQSKELQKVRRLLKNWQKQTSFSTSMGRSNDVTHLGGWGIYQKVALLHKPI